jgi:Tol biopolymer transport system component
MSNPDSTMQRAQQAVDRVLASRTFQGTGRSGALLRFIVERAAAGRADELKEYTLGAEALGRGTDFDPKNDSIARVEASRLRTRLELYYATEGRDDAVRIVLPKGSYVPQFETRATNPSANTESARNWKIATAVSAVAAVTAILIAMRPPTPAAESPLHAEVNLGPGVSLRSTQVGSSSVVLSPDGRTLAFVSFEKQVPRLMTLRLDRDSRPQTLAGSEGARGPFFSPDGMWLGYWAGAKLWKVPVDGGTPAVLCEAQDLLGASWGDDNTIIAAITTSGLFRIPAAGGKPEAIPGVPEDVGPRWPQVLPGSKAILFSAGAPARGPARIMVLSTAENQAKELGIGGGHARYVKSGHLVWVNGGNLMAAPFDLARLALTAKPAAYAADVATGMYGSAEFDVSGSGVLVYRRSGGTKSIIQMLDASGKATPVVNEPGEYSWPRVSPDGRRLSFLAGKIEQRDAVELRVMDLVTRRILKSVTGVVTSSPVWSPDGRFLVFPKTGGGLSYISAEDADGEKPLLAAEGLQIPWSFGSKRLAFYQRGMTKEAPSTFDLWTLPLLPSEPGRLTAGKPEPYVVSNEFELFPSFSPDGQWITFTRFASGGYEIHVRAFPDTGRQWRVSPNGGVVATWSRDRRQILYQTIDGEIMSADWSVNGGDFQSGTPRRWGMATVSHSGIAPSIDAARLGGLVALTPVPGTEIQDDHHATIVLNFPNAVQQRN